MPTVFFLKKYFTKATMPLLFVFLIGSLFFAGSLSGAQKIGVARTFYFLATDSLHIQTSVHNAQALGGAGYLLQEKDRDYVVFSAYLTEEECWNAETQLLLDVGNTVVIEQRCGNLYLKNGEKKYANYYAGAFDTLYNLLGILNGEIKRLSNGGTQEDCKRVLEILRKQFAYLAENTPSIFPEYAVVCQNAEKELNAITQGVVYGEDLRYLLCSLCVSYIDLTHNFVL